MNTYNIVNKMMKLAIVLALAVAVSAGGSCFWEKDFACVKKDAVKCGSDWCHGQCALENVKACDSKVWYKTLCEEEEFCKEVTTPCGHEGDYLDGLYCGAKEKCIVDKQCKIVKKLRGYDGWVSKKMAGGLFQVCKDVFSCAALDPWEADEEDVEIICKKEYKIVEDYDCDHFWGLDYVWGAGGISRKRFFMLNSKFDCGKKLVGKTVCVEADIKFKTYPCGGSYCDEGYECATKEKCIEVPVKKPVCAVKPIFTCVHDLSKATVCGSQVCHPGHKCEVITTKVCPDVHVPVVPVVPVTPVVPVKPVVPVVPVTPVVPDVPEPAAPLAAATSTSLSAPGGTKTVTDALSIGGDATATANALNDDAESDSSSTALKDGTATATTFTDAGDGQVAEADADALSIVVEEEASDK